MRGRLREAEGANRPVSVSASVSASASEVYWVLRG
jgi:hypothetical protein